MSLQNQEDSRTFDVMLSYCWQQKETVGKILASLRKRKLSVWIDLDNMGGDIFAKMKEAVDSCQVFVPCLSKDYEASPNCNREINYAAIVSKPFVPLRLDLVPLKRTQLIIAGLFYVDLTDVSESEWESKMDKLASEIQNLKSQGNPASQDEQLPTISPTISPTIPVHQNQSAVTLSSKSIHPMCIGTFGKAITVLDDGIVSHSGRSNVNAVFVNPFTFIFHWDDGDDQIWTLGEEGIYQNCNNLNCGQDNPQIFLKNGIAKQNTKNQAPFTLGTFRDAIVENDKLFHCELEIEIVWLNPYAFKFNEPNPQLWIYDVRRDGYLQIGKWENAVWDAVQNINGSFHQRLQKVEGYLINMTIHPTVVGIYNNISIGVDGVISHAGRQDVVGDFINPFTFSFHWNNNNDQVWTLCENGLLQMCNTFDPEKLNSLGKRYKSPRVENLLELAPLMIAPFAGDLNETQFFHAGFNIQIDWLNPFTFMFMSPNPQVWTFDTRRKGYLQIGTWEYAVLDALQ
ncbi:hypothetical protein HK096_005260, partial [Nowakowskiella sp. JEL0078]